MTYHIKYNKYTKGWLVINSVTGDGQSEWGDKITALRVAKDLNKAIRKLAINWCQ